MKDIKPGDQVIFRRTKRRCYSRATVVKANRVNLACTAPYQLGAVGIGEILTLNLSFPRNEVDEVWRDGVKVYDSGRVETGLSE
jgi:hypothetical protein